MPNIANLDSNANTLLLLTHTPDHAQTLAGLEFATQFCQKQSCQKLSTNTATQEPNHVPTLRLFLYRDAVMLANRLIWQADDMPNAARDWQRLVQQFGLTAQVCVSSALARGVTDSANAKRHGLDGNNLATGFTLVGLGELAMALHEVPQVYQF
ncbi:DsrE family protein [Moraxella atlantae]|uniref:DsrE family protein n=1 Tax=Faucicola atlantae TaxID=34059 RepID=UPI003750C797